MNARDQPMSLLSGDLKLKGNYMYYGTIAWVDFERCVSRKGHIRGDVEREREGGRGVCVCGMGWDVCFEGILQERIASCRSVRHLSQA